MSVSYYFLLQDNDVQSFVVDDTHGPNLIVCYKDQITWGTLPSTGTDEVKFTEYNFTVLGFLTNLDIDTCYHYEATEHLIVGQKSAYEFIINYDDSTLTSAGIWYAEYGDEFTVVAYRDPEICILLSDTPDNF